MLISLFKYTLMFNFFLHEGAILSIHLGGPTVKHKYTKVYSPGIQRPQPFFLTYPHQCVQHPSVPDFSEVGIICLALNLEPCLG